MRSSGSTETKTAPAKERVAGASIGLALPIRESALFKHAASRHILNFLGDNPDINVSIRQLSSVTPVSERATREAVEVLDANELVETFHQGNARRVQINRARLTKPSDPIHQIPQTQFQTPARVARHYIEDELDDVLGIVLFGSVARGDADRQSDIDLWVLVGDDHMQQRHDANKLTQHLEGLSIPASIPVSDANAADFESDWNSIRETLEADDQTGPSAQRYAYEILVETPQSILNQADRVDAEELFGEGITLLSTETLERVKMEVVTDE